MNTELSALKIRSTYANIICYCIANGVHTLIAMVCIAHFPAKGNTNITMSSHHDTITAS